MNNLTPEQNQLSASWAAVYEGAGQALEWIGQTRGNAPRLDSEADNLNIRLHRARNLAHSLGRVACTPMTIGFFGLSQAGKSYLISALAAGQNGKLETQFGNRRLDFIKHINPVGNGKEATGLVTRFSRRAEPSPDANFPVQLTLFKEIELAKIFTNSWFKDFDLERMDYQIDEERIQRALKPFEGRENGPLQSGVNADDIVSLWDYVRETAPNSVKKLEHGYWPKVLQLAPRLSAQERAELFCILWGEQRELTRAYQQLAGALHKLGLPEKVFAPVHALVRFEENGTAIQRDNIMNVDILERFGTPNDGPIDVRPLIDGHLHNSQSITVAQLAALTAEMTFGLIEAPADDIVNQVDLLDFPGYRGRKSLLSIADSNDPASSNKENSVSQLILRGKVAYLFERYTDCQEMNALVVCTGSTKQSDVNDVGPVLSRWINKTQGSTAQERRKRAAGLIWALTMLDMRITGALDQSPDQYDEGWSGMVKLTMLERFGGLPWMEDWDGAPFQNTFMVRKPRLTTAFIQLDQNGSEVGINPDFQARIDGMGKSFASNSFVCQHVKDPAMAWQEMLRIDDGGISHFSGSFKGVANIEFKLQRIREQLNECIESLTTHGLSTWYHADGDGAAAVKKAQAQMILSGLGRRPAVLGEFIDQLDMPSEEVRDLYLSGVYETDDVPDASEEAVAPTPSQSLYGNDAGFDFDFGDDSSHDSALASSAKTNIPAPELQSNEHRFAKAAFKAWIAHLRDLTTRQNLLNLLGLEKPLLEAVVDELITAGYRQDLPGQLSRAVLKRAQSGARRDQLVERQVLEVQRVLRDFVSWFGYIQKPLSERPNSRAGAKLPLFSFYTDIGPGQVPVLPAQPANQAQLFLGDWLSGLAYITLDNAGHGAGREITPEQNERLGQVLTAFTAR
ncbi:putative virulence factor [Pseudomonas sp. PD9R]|uniref:putative virulence factor n=1 Tax=Pseudomonas sp. PD9R TaxID=2853534 RepID=UPI001C48E4D2|nr:virulence factor SrfC family protein [Pseudomonas sp. PD9R]MBV6824760.1 putative virulence factor [Pseudomonas sp. PD9R]